MAHLALFTQVPRRRILRTSPVGRSQKSAYPRSNTDETPELRSAALGHYPDFPIIPSGCVLLHGSSWVDRTEEMGLSQDGARVIAHQYEAITDAQQCPGQEKL